MTNRVTVLALTNALLLAAAAGCGGDSTNGAASLAASTASAGTSGTAAAPTPAKRYSLAATRRCLRNAGLRLSGVDKTNPRLQALSDLAQRTSIFVRVDGKVIGLAFGDAGLLAELLAVPRDPYTIETRGNAVLLYPRSARLQASAVRRCLRS